MATLFARPQHTLAAEGGNSYTITFPIEKIRLAAYFFFASLCLFAKLLFENLVLERIEEGAPEGTPTEQLGCGAFNRDFEQTIYTKFPLHFGDGFNLATSHLTELFGFTNVCVYWDYYPAREIIGMYFPLFEYSLFIYVFIDFIYVMLAFRRGEVPSWYFKMVKVVTPITCLLIIWFRMIFVFVAYENPRAHSCAFLGMQLALLSVALMNTLFVVLSGQSYPTLGLSKSTTTWVAYTYLICNIAVSSIKIYATTYIVFNTFSPDFYKEQSIVPSLLNGELLDKFWMLFNAVIPIFIAYTRMNNEHPLTIEFSVPTPTYEGDKQEDSALSETTSLVN